MTDKKCGDCCHWKQMTKAQIDDYWEGIEANWRIPMGFCSKIHRGTKYNGYTFDGATFADECFNDVFNCWEER